MRRIVVKVGTSTLSGSAAVGAGVGLDRVYINGLAAQVDAQRKRGRQVVLVSSGAIRAGVGGLGLTEKPRTIPEKQAAASVGQGLLMALYADVFANYGIPVGQILLTRDDLRSRARYVNARNTMEALLAAGALPIVNENDTVATDEIRVGDNDTLAALVTSLLDADALLLLSDVDGLYDRNPTLFPDARRIARVERIDAATRAMAGDAGTPGGTGGMRTKLIAAQIATASGAALWIANGRLPNILAACVDADNSGDDTPGTYFAPAPTRPSARKRWLAWASGTPTGVVVVNANARRALEEEGRSLLPVGVIGTTGDAFAPGDLIGIADESGELFARGLARYGDADVRRSAGFTTSGLADSLGRAAPHSEVVHRDSLVLVPPSV